MRELAGSYVLLEMATLDNEIVEERVSGTWEEKRGRRTEGRGGEGRRESRGGLIWLHFLDN